MESIDETDSSISTRVYNELGDPLPGVVSWFAAILALGLSVRFLFLGGDAVTGLRYARLQAEFSEQAKPRADLEKLVQSREFKPLFTFHSDTLKRIRPIFAMIAANDLSSASELLGRSDAPRHPLLMAMAGRLRRIVKDEAQTKKLVSDERFYQERAPALWERYKELRSSLANVIGSTAGFPENMQFSYYSAGILKDMPAVPGIPDGLPTEQELRRFREPGASDERPEAPLAVKLQGIRQSTMALREEMSSLQNEAEKRAGLRESYAERQKRASREARALLRRLLNELARQTFPLSVRRSYAFLASILNGLRLEAPELKIDEKQTELSDSEIDAILSSTPDE